MTVYCGQWWEDLWTPFNSIKVPVFISVCSLGVLVNVINLTVFTRKRMLNPTNLILTALAVTDFLSVFRLLIRLSLYAYGQNYGEWRSPYQLAVEELIHDILFVLLHTWSIYLTLTIAIWRFLGVVYPLKSKYWFTWRAAKGSILTALTLGSLLMPLLFYDRHIGLKADRKDVALHRFLPTCKEIEGFAESPYEIRRSVLGDQIAWWTHAIIIKILPCITMTIFSVGLVLSLIKAGRIRKRLRTPGKNFFESHQDTGIYPENKGLSKEVVISKLEQDSELSTKPLLSHLQTYHNISGHSKENCNHSLPAPVDPLSIASLTNNKGQKINGRREAKEGEDFHRTTKMLLVVLILFLITEFPSGIFGVIRVALDDMDFYSQCYVPVRPFFNINEYLSCVTSFFVYLIMSAQFRTTLMQIRSSGFTIIRRVSWKFSSFSNSNSNSTPSSSRKSINSSLITSTHSTPASSV